MKRLRELTDPSEIKQGMLLLTVDHDHNESVDLIEGIDNGKVYSYDHTGYGSIEPLNTFLTDYLVVYEIL